MHSYIEYRSLNVLFSVFWTRVDTSCTTLAYKWLIVKDVLFTKTLWTSSILLYFIPFIFNHGPLNPCLLIFMYKDKEGNVLVFSNWREWGTLHLEPPPSLQTIFPNALLYLHAESCGDGWVCFLTYMLKYIIFIFALPSKKMTKEFTLFISEWMQNTNNIVTP